MKPDNFNNDLKKMAEGFELKVNPGAFDKVVLKQKRQRRKGVFIWLGSILATGVISIFLFQPEHEVNLQSFHKSIGQAERQQKAEDKTTIKTAGAKDDSGGTFTAIKTSPKEQILTDKNIIEPNAEQGFSGNRIVNRNNARSKYKSSTTVITGFIPTEKTTATKHEPAGIIETVDTEPISPKTNINQNLPDTFISYPADVQLSMADQSVDSLKMENIPANAENKADRQKRVDAGIYFNYYAISNAINSALLVPLNKPDSFGLRNKANYGFSYGAKISYALSASFKINIGLGINTLQFDKVRLTEVRLDSIKSTELMNVGNTKSVKNYSLKLVEQSFTWLEVPLGLSYTTAINKKLAFTIESGMVLLTLIQHTGYEFSTSNAGDLKYDNVKDKGTDRINQRLMQLYLTPGLEYQVSNKLLLSGGIIYRNFINSYYKSDYYNTGNIYQLGMSVNMKYKF